MKMECNHDKFDKIFVENLFKRFQEHFSSSCSIEIKEIKNFEYETPYVEPDKIIRHLQKGVSKNTQLEFLKNYDIFNLQHDLLKKYLSVKYKFWNENMKGQNIKIALFDSGINNEFINCNLIKNINLTNEDNEDYTGHGTYLASILCGKELGIAPEILLYSIKIFDKKQKTFSSWLFKGLDFAIQENVNIINLSFGGINFNDELIKNKLKEAAEKGILIIVSSGNDGPSYGTINFPGNLPYVITVGATSDNIFSILNTSSRGPAIYSKNIIINKPNTWTPGENIIGINKEGNYIIKKGSSVSTILATGFLSLIISNKKLNENEIFKNRYLNIYNIILNIRDSNISLPNINMNEITSGIFNPDGLLYLLLFKLQEFDESTKVNEYSSHNQTESKYNTYMTKNFNKTEENETISFNPIKVRKISLFNNIVDFSLNHHSNYTMSYKSKLNNKKVFYSTKQPELVPLLFYHNSLEYSDDIFIKLVNDIKMIRTQRRTDIFQCLKIEFFDENFTPLKENFVFKGNYGILVLKVYITDNFKCSFIKDEVEFNIHFLDKYSSEYIEMKMTMEIIVTPSKFNRLIVDRYHNLIYPFDGIILRDDLYNPNYNFDWTFESLDTNYYNLNAFLKNAGYFIEEANVSLDYIDLQLYSVLILIDNEKNLTKSEVENLKFQFENNNLSFFIASEWNNKRIKGFISNTLNQNEIEVVDGAEIYTINNFIDNYGFEIGEDSLSYEFYFNKQTLKSGNSIKKFPSNGYLFGNNMRNDLHTLFRDQNKESYSAVLGIIDKNSDIENSGRMSIFTDSYCLDDYQLGFNTHYNCFSLIESILRFLIHGKFAKNDLELDYQNILKLDFISNNVNLTFDDINKTSSNKTYFETNVSSDNIDNIANLNYTDQDVVSSIFYENFKSNNYYYKGTQDKTSIIPNLLYRKNKIKEENEEKEGLKTEKISALYYIFKDILYILSPLIIIIAIILLIIKCKQSNFTFRNKKMILKKFSDISRSRSNYSDFSNPNRSFSLNNINRRDSKIYINLTNTETVNDSMDEKSVMISEI